MPKLMKYLTGSIVFFIGDEAEYVYLLQEGYIRLDYLNIETGKEEVENIQPGEFFGVKSTLSKYPREETATVIKDSKVICFKLDEFQNLAQSNVRLILKMMKIYSNQLRVGHKLLSKLLDSEDAKTDDAGLYNVSKYYSSIGKKNIALSGFKKYLEENPYGEHADEIKSMLGQSVDENTPEALINKVKFEYNSCRWKKTIDVGIEFIKKYPKSNKIVEVLLMMANSNINIGQVDNARSLIAKIRALSPNSDMMPQLEKIESKLE